MDTKAHLKFDDLASVSDPSVKASLLTAFCKEYDLTDPAYAGITASIAKWIDSDNEDLRREVVFALCGFCTVKGFEHLSILGWKQSSPLDIHWYASAIENSFTSAAQISMDVLLEIASTALRSDRAFLGDQMDLLDNNMDARFLREASLRVIRHFHAVVFPDKPVDFHNYHTVEVTLMWKRLLELIQFVHSGRD